MTRIEIVKHRIGGEHVDDTGHTARNKVKIGFDANAQLRFVFSALGPGKSVTKKR